jgi:hypothetical protein
VRWWAGACVALAAVLAGPGAASAAAAESYRDLVEAYLHGDGAALARAGRRSRADLRGEVKRLREARACTRCADHDVADSFPFLGAVLVHTACAFRAAEKDDAEGEVRFHLDLAEELLEISPPPVRRFEADWILATGEYSLRRLETRRAHHYFQMGLERFPADARFQLLEGVTLEAEARLAPARDAARWSETSAERRALEDATERRSLLLKAEALFARAIATEPASAEARLRRGRVLIHLGREAEGKAELDWVLQHVAGGSLHSLAALFLGLFEERAGHWPAAVARYEEAVRTGPQGARAAAVALAHALDEAGERTRAQAVVDRLLSEPGPRDPFDGYIVGPEGELERLLESMRLAAMGR